jgi:transcription elongation factor Elf1
MKKKRKKQPNMQRKPRQAPDETVRVACSQCGHSHTFASLEVLDTTSILTPCEACGHPFLAELQQKLDAVLNVLASDPQSVELLHQDNFDAFHQLVKLRTGVKLGNSD